MTKSPKIIKSNVKTEKLTKRRTDLKSKADENLSADILKNTYFANCH
jgi:hypothetical protein